MYVFYLSEDILKIEINDQQLCQCWLYSYENGLNGSLTVSITDWPYNKWGYQQWASVVIKLCRNNTGPEKQKERNALFEWCTQDILFYGYMTSKHGIGPLRQPERKPAATTTWATLFD